ncbi:putative oxidoreductase C-terminal domain-containing protein [Paludibaculum fermentans]|uniref:putative oxidoreductase C-terminal domain-containing protein n=1 Tax=Paludibaculum fermentans TaxID=1473598 RepID=UPI003EC01A11
MAAAITTGAELRLITLDPAHFHAAQMHTGPLEGFSRDAYIYAPVGRDLASFWTAVSGLTARSNAPDHWRYITYVGPDFFERMMLEKRGDVVMLSGRNARKIEYLRASINAGLHVLADKPWIIEPADLPKLEAALDDADRRGVIAYDAMTQRFDIAYQLQREIVNDPAIFGKRDPGSPEQSAVEMVSSHSLLKTFNGVTNLRPAWYFDIHQQGEALADVGTHVVDLAHWTLFPDQSLDYRKDIRLLQAKRWPTTLTLDEFRRVTGEPGFPDYLRDSINDGRLDYYTNNSLLYTARGLHITLRVTWEYASPAGDRDSMLAIYRGGLAEVAVRAGKEQRYLPEVDVTPRRTADALVVRRALESRLSVLSGRYPGLTVREDGGRLHVVIPPVLRINDAEYFLLLAQRFAGYIRNPGTLPKWERPNMVTKYYVTTHGVELARRSR